MTLYEIARLLAEPFLPVLHGKVRRDLRKILREHHLHGASVLDVGARRSPYTVGLPAQITLLDVPQEGAVMEQLRLGFTEEVLARNQQRRSNINGVVVQDMTQCTLPSESYEAVVCVEVIEHVPDDESFVYHIARVIKPGGWAYFTTPNGDYIKNDPPNYNPDHVRHYKRTELKDLLERHFGQVEVCYGVRTGRNRVRGLKSMSFRHPLRTLGTMVSNVFSHIESRRVEHQAHRTAHLLALARKGAE